MYHFYSQIDNLFSGKVTRLYQIKKKKIIGCYQEVFFFLVGDFLSLYKLREDERGGLSCGYT